MANLGEATDQADILIGGSGHDTIEGGRGDDIVEGGSYSDVLHGNEGRDVVLGGSGDDVVRGGDGRDIVRGGSGDDFVNGGDGTDFLLGGTGDDHLLGAGGDDHLWGGDRIGLDADLHLVGIAVIEGGHERVPLRHVDLDPFDQLCAADEIGVFDLERLHAGHQLGLDHRARDGLAIKVVRGRPLPLAGDRVRVPEDEGIHRATPPSFGARAPAET